MSDLFALAPEICQRIYAHLLHAIAARPKFGTLDAAVLHVIRQVRSEAVKVLHLSLH